LRDYYLAPLHLTHRTGQGYTLTWFGSHPWTQIFTLSFIPPFWASSHS